MTDVGAPHHAARGASTHARRPTLRTGPTVDAAWTAYVVTTMGLTPT